jgi:hypothetical protein
MQAPLSKIDLRPAKTAKLGSAEAMPIGQQDRTSIPGTIPASLTRSVDQPINLCLRQILGRHHRQGGRFFTRTQQSGKFGHAARLESHPERPSDAGLSSRKTELNDYQSHVQGPRYVAICHMFAQGSRIVARLSPRGQIV